MGHQGIASQESLDVVEEVPSPQKKSRRKLPGEGKVREANAAGLKEGAASKIPELLRKLCLRPSYILERQGREIGAGAPKKPVTRQGWLAAAETNTSCTPSITLWGFNVLCCYGVARYVCSCDSQREAWFGAEACAKSARLFAVCTSPRGARAGPGAAGPESLVFRKGLQTEKNPQLPVLRKCSRGNVWVSCLSWTWAQGPHLIWEAVITALHLRPVTSASLNLVVLLWGPLQGVARVCCKVRHMRITFPVEQSGGEVFMQPDSGQLPEPWSISLPAWNRQESKLVWMGKLFSDPTTPIGLAYLR